MATEDRQADKLPVTTSSIITEDTGTFLGLPGKTFFLVIVVTMVSAAFGNILISDKAGFPIAVVVGLITWTILKLYLQNKPPYFLLHAIMYFVKPKKFIHRPREKKPVLRKSY
jgi:hypothetical protein